MKRPPKYNPGFLDDRGIIDLFCVRHRELESVVRTIANNTGDINQHLMIIGPRGSGKTALLRRLAAKIRETPELNAGWYPVVLMEENYEILSLRDLWQEALYYLTGTPATTGSGLVQLWHDTPVASQAVNDTYAAMKNPPGGSQNPYLENIALAHLLAFAERQNKRLLLVCENMNDLLSELPSTEAWKLRGILQTEKRIMLAGSATARFDEIDNRKEAFYDFFKIVELQRLTTEECAELWLSVSGKELAGSQAEALRILTGGMPRLLSILAWFGRQLSFLELMEDLEILIDDHTDYFKSGMETLPPKERKVFASLAKLWVNSPVGLVANEAGMGQPETSAILNRLVKRGIVEEYLEEGERQPVKRGKTYQLTERLFNIYYLMRRGGTDALFVHDVVHFLVQVFGVDADKAVRDLCNTPPQSLSERQRRYGVQLSNALTMGVSGQSSMSDNSSTSTDRENEETPETLREILERQRKELGPEHPHTLNTLLNLLSVYGPKNTTAVFSILEELLTYPAYVRENTDFVTSRCVRLAAFSHDIARQVADTIDKSLSKETIYPLLAGIKLYLGEKMRLPREVREIAKVIRKRIQEAESS